MPRYALPGVETSGSSSTGVWTLLGITGVQLEDTLANSFFLDLSLAVRAAILLSLMVFLGPELLKGRVLESRIQDIF